MKELEPLYTLTLGFGVHAGGVGGRTIAFIPSRNGELPVFSLSRDFTSGFLETEDSYLGG